MKKSGKDRLKCAVCESTLSTAVRSPFPKGEGKEEAASPPPKEANPASLRSAAPSKGRGSRGHFLLPVEGGAPKGRRLDGGSGMKKSGKIVSSASFARAPYPPLRGPSSPMGKAAIRGCRFSSIVKANTGYVEKKNNDGQSLPRVGKVASKASRIGQWRYER